MNNQLSNIAVQYRKFSKGQYVDHTQFNEFLDFFEDQDRLSKVMLQGMGIVCGLKPNLIYTNKLLSNIQLSQGVALTTDGDLLTLNNTSEVSEELYVSDLKTINIESKNYTHFKVYDNFKAEYQSFYDGNKDQIELWELATAQEAKSDFQSINNLPNLEDKYLLLYLENYEKEVKPCSGVDCDNHGIQQIRNLKVLVTTKNGIDNILGEEGVVIDPLTGESKKSRKDRIQPHPLFIEDVLRAEKQERVIVERLVLEKGTDFQLSPLDLRDLYLLALEKNGYGEFVFKKINEISGVIGARTIDHQAFKNTLENVFTQRVGFQYAYDVVKDLMDTYWEIIKLLPKSFAKGFPDLESFPKHIMLGKLVSNIELDAFRHKFYNSLVLDDNKATQKVKVLIDRFHQQAENFKYPFDSEIEIDIENGLQIGNKSKIKITPSQKLNPLSDKAIPFYYQVTDEFLKTWNFDKTSNRSSKNNLGYNAGSFSTDEHIQQPTSFNIDRNSFYNIEGHQGMTYEAAFEEIKEIRDKYQLGFDIMLLSFGELKGNKDMFKAYFNEYVEKHPGLEHKRGVERGGTFVMVYEINGRDTSIVADFSLPYICCTPKIVAELSLSSAVICAESNPIPFTVLPVGGVVKAVVDSELNGVEIIDGKYFFNPKLLDVSLHGQVITFTVNGKPTNCSIKVIAEPEVSVVVDHIFYIEGNNSIATTVNMLVSGEDFRDYTYSWDFWDNGSFITLKPDDKGRVEYTFYNLVPTRIPTIKVKVSGSGCTQDISIRDWYDAPVKLSLPTDVICSESELIPFNVSPVGGIVKASAGNGVELIQGQYFFNPQLIDDSLHGQVITFTVNNQSTNCNIKVVTQPEVNIAVKSVNYISSTEATVNFEVSGLYFANYTYSVNGNLVSPGPDGNGNMSYTFTNLDPQNIPTINVTVSNGKCAQTSVIRSWYNPPVEPSVVINSIIFPKGNCCEGARNVTAFVENDEKTVYLSTSEIFELKGWAVGALNFNYSWFQSYSSNNVTLPLEVSTEPTLVVSRLSAGTYEFQFMAIDSDTGEFDTKTVRVFIYG